MSLLFVFCAHVKPIWEIVNIVILPRELIGYGMAMFGYETDQL